jgi:tripartite-type tricarboxylate transporter receptor subunit TctC
VAPPKTPANLQKTIAEAAIETVKMADVQAFFQKYSFDVVGSSPVETATFIQNEARRWGDLIKQTGVSLGDHP